MLSKGSLWYRRLIICRAIFCGVVPLAEKIEGVPKNGRDKGKWKRTGQRKFEQEKEKAGNLKILDKRCTRSSIYVLNSVYV